ncbi:hypothetical protein TRAPUB_4258 [Trametes pubescens]|uniref:Uncharacterized protein n=1 Tax=Trametes pubescens TaxID=154538 RepID=A0A1M2VBM7_TRAPU|nr:hypothetical protein TRAPUB_4258 [Trametes pubescens]
MGTFHLYTLARGAARLGFTRVHSVHLALQGETGTGLTLILPTCDPDDLDPEFFEGWLATIQGPAVTAAANDNDNDKHVFLLRVVLTYRAFATQHPSLTIEKYHKFTLMFVVSSLALDSDDDAAHDLAVIDDWMTENIPLWI